MARIINNRAEPKRDAKLERLISKNEKWLFREPTERNIEKSNRAGESLAEYALKGATPKQIDEYDTISGTFKHPDELHDYARKIVAENKMKGRR